MSRKYGVHRSGNSGERASLTNENTLNLSGAVEQTIVVAEKSWLRRHAGHFAAGLALTTAVSFAVAEVAHVIRLSSEAGRTTAGAEQTPGAVVPSVEATTASASASASASPSASPSAIKSSAAPTHKAVVVAAPTTHAAPSVAPKSTTARPSPVHTTPKPEANCWTKPASPDPLIECSPAVTPTDLAGAAGSPENNLTISANSANVHVNLSDVIPVGGTDYVEVYDSAQANNGTGWIPEADLAGRH